MFSIGWRKFRGEKVAKARRAIAAGTMDTPGHVGVAVERMLDEGVGHPHTMHQDTGHVADDKGNVKCYHCNGTGQCSCRRCENRMGGGKCRVCRGWGRLRPDGKPVEGDF